MAQKKTTKNKSQKSSNVNLGAAAVGAAVGVGLGAAAIALSSEKNRKTIVKKSGEVKKQAGKTLAKGRQELLQAQKQLKSKMNGAMANGKAVSNGKKTVTQAVNKTVKKAAVSSRATKPAARKSA